jgi:DNA-binding LacI/PurR family transcriptional regulator
MKTTLHDVASKAQVSFTTVSKILNSRYRDKFSAETVLRIQTAAAELGYESNHFARSLKTGKTHIIGVTFFGRKQLTSFTDPYLGELYTGIGACAMERNYKLIFHSIQADARIDQTLELAQQGMVDGLIYILFSSALDKFQQELAPYLQKLNIPVVLVHSSTQDFGFPAVGLNCVTGGRLATEHLIGHGHRDITMVVPSLELELYRDFIEGHAEALTAHGLEFNSKQVRVAPGHTFQSGVRFAEELMATGSVPCAMVVPEESTAYGLMRKLTDSGMRVPQDVGLISFGGHENPEHRDSDLTVVRQPAREKGFKATEKLLAQIEDKGQEQAAPRTVVLEPELLVRRSCGRRESTKCEVRTEEKTEAGHASMFRAVDRPVLVP